MPTINRIGINYDQYIGILNEISMFLSYSLRYMNKIVLADSFKINIPFIKLDTYITFE
jgi:hypothetical protein